jgi:hypothetical protein
MSYGKPTMRLSARDRRALRLGVMLAAPALVYVLAAKPYYASVQAAKASLATQRDLLDRERALVAGAPLLPKQTTIVRAAAAQARERLYTDADPITATAALGRDITQAFEDAGIALQHTEAREPVKRPEGLRELTIDLRAEGDFEGILYMLSLLEGDDRLLRVSRVGIERRVGQAGDQNATEVLGIVATVHGYMP